MKTTAIRSAEPQAEGSMIQSTLRLSGLDGTNPLGFLATVGLFRVVTRSLSPMVAKLSWVADGGTWLPEIFGTDLTASRLLQLLTDAFSDQAEHPASALFASRPKQSETSNPTQASRRKSLLQQLSAITRKNVDAADWIAAVRCDTVQEDAINQLQTVRRDYFAGNIRSILDRTLESHLERAIFSPWDYADALDNQSLHLDPTEDRRHAHQWAKPSGDPNRKTQGGMLGANRLALEAIPIFVSIPAGDSLRTLGFSGHRSSDTRWTWPIWNQPIELDLMRSLFGLQELQKPKPTTEDLKSLHARGIVAAFRTRRILVGKTPNFTPPEQIA